MNNTNLDLNILQLFYIIQQYTLFDYIVKTNFITPSFQKL